MLKCWVCGKFPKSRVWIKRWKYRFCSEYCEDIFDKKKEEERGIFIGWRKGHKLEELKKLLVKLDARIENYKLRRSRLAEKIGLLEYSKR